MACFGPPQTRTPRPPPAEPAKAYGPPFWFAYVANTLVMVAVALLFRYADFVTLLGGTEFHLGWIVGVGMVGSLTMRLLIGRGIDHYGPKVVWLGSVALFSAACFAHLAITSCTGPAIYMLRILWCCAIGGNFGASMTFISGRVPTPRLAEMIGMLGTSGFVGMVLGTQLGDLLLGSETIHRGQVEQMFLAAGSLGGVALVFVWLATRRHVPGEPPRSVRLFAVLRRHHPGSVLLVGMAMGMGLGMPATFLRTYAATLDIPRIGLFFGVYAPTALVTRVLTRRLPERFGTRPMILSGLGLLVLSQLLFLLVGSQWQLILPAAGYGVAHAVMFPSVVAAGSRVFPEAHRGLGTTLILGTYDAGQVVGAPAVGAILHYSARLGLPSYPTMFLCMAALLAAVGLLYGRSLGREEAPAATIPAPRAERFAPRSGCSPPGGEAAAVRRQDPGREIGTGQDGLGGQAP